MPIKILAEFLVDIEKLSLNFIEKDKGTRITEIALSKKNKVGGFLDLFAFKWQWTKVWHWQRDNNIDQCNRSDFSYRQ